MITSILKISAAFICLSVTSQLHAQQITGAISHYRDGDTFLIGKQPICICGIDAPESNTKAGKLSTAYIKKITRGKAVKCVPVSQGTVCDGRSKRTNRDRIVAQCFVQGRDIADLLVGAGHACDWPKFSGGAYSGVGRCAR